MAPQQKQALGSELNLKEKACRLLCHRMSPPDLCILIADDNQDSANSLAMLLECYGHRPIVTYSGADAADVASKHCPQMAILDIHMPGLDGLDTARALRRTCDGLVYIVAHSGVGTAEVALHARQAGFDRFLPKPISPGQLLELVQAAQELTVRLQRGEDAAGLHPGNALS